jgi:hypothetical protein
MRILSNIAFGAHNNLSFGLTSDAKICSCVVNLSLYVLATSYEQEHKMA